MHVKNVVTYPGRNKPWTYMFRHITMVWLIHVKIVERHTNTREISKRIKSLCMKELFILVNIAPTSLKEKGN